MTANMDCAMEGSDATRSEASSPEKSTGNRNSFRIQDILSPGFGNRQLLQEQYMACLQYYYRLQVQSALQLYGRLQGMGDKPTGPAVPFAGLDRTVRAQSMLAGMRIPGCYPMPPGMAGLTPPLVSIAAREREARMKLRVELPEKRHSDLEPVDSPTLSPTSSCSQSEQWESPRGLPAGTGAASTPGSTSYSDKPSPGRERADSDKTDSTRSNSDSNVKDGRMWPAWVYCTRYSDRPSSGKRLRPRSRKKGRKDGNSSDDGKKCSEKRPRIAFTSEQLAILKREFEDNRYLTEERRSKLASDLNLSESQVKIWFQNKRAKLKKSSGTRNPLALQLMAQGLYNHSTVSTGDE